jgi:hypothetical protein
MPRRVDEPVGGDDERDQPVYDEVDPADVRVETLLEAREQQREDDAGDGDVEGRGPADGVEASAPLVRAEDGGCEEDGSREEVALDGKKVKKLAVSNPGTVARSVANW